MLIDSLLNGEYAARYTTSGFWQDKLITDYLDAHVRKTPDKEAIVDRWGRITWRQLGAAVDRVASGLHELGIGPGDVMVLQLPNWHQFVVLHLALTRLGAITSNVVHVYRHHELRSMLGVTQAKAIAVPAEYRGFDYRLMLRQLRGEVLHLGHVVVVGGEVPSDMVSYADLLATPVERCLTGDEFARLRPDPNAVTHIGFTSGTSGEPKGAMHTSNTLGAGSATGTQAFDLGENDVFFMSTPIGYNLGFYYGVRIAVFTGGKLVLQEQWEPAEGLALMAKEGATYTMAATSLLQDIVYSPDLALFDRLPALRTFVVGAAPVPPQLIADAQKLLPNLFVSNGYGMSETCAVSYVLRSSPPDRVLNSCGTSVAGAEFKIVGADGQELPPGIAGELIVRTPQHTLGYYRRADLDGETYFGDGFFRTGDEARIDADGFLTVTGRIKDLIIRGGANISPAELENILVTHPKIDRVAVVGVPDDRLGERVCACVVPQAGQAVTFEDVVEWVARAGVAKYKWPQRLEVLDELPMSAIGKVLKSTLRDRILAVV